MMTLEQYKLENNIWELINKLSTAEIVYYFLIKETMKQIKQILLIMLSSIFLINISYANNSELVDRRLDVFCNTWFIGIASEGLYLYNNEYILKEQWDTKGILNKTKKLLNQLNSYWLNDLNTLKESNFFNDKLNKFLCIENSIDNEKKLEILDNVQKYINWRESVSYRINDYYISLYMKKDINFMNSINDINWKYNNWIINKSDLDNKMKNNLKILKSELVVLINIKNKLSDFGINLN